MLNQSLVPEKVKKTGLKVAYKKKVYFSKIIGGMRMITIVRIRRRLVLKVALFRPDK